MPAAEAHVHSPAQESGHRIGRMLVKILLHRDAQSLWCFHQWARATA